jgi:hypothetical protein
MIKQGLYGRKKRIIDDNNKFISKVTYFVIPAKAGIQKALDSVSSTE